MAPSGMARKLNGIQEVRGSTPLGSTKVAMKSACVAVPVDDRFRLPLP